jgi:3-dehydroquinate dehydratase-2
MSFEDYLEAIRKRYEAIEIQYLQSNHEGEIITAIQNAHEAGFSGIVLNAGGYSHSSVAIADAVASGTLPVIGVHISNIYSREAERHRELLAQYLQAGIFGMGLQGYELAIRHLISLNNPTHSSE